MVSIYWQYRLAADIRTGPPGLWRQQQVILRLDQKKLTASAGPLTLAAVRAKFALRLILRRQALTRPDPGSISFSNTRLSNSMDPGHNITPIPLKNQVMGVALLSQQMSLTVIWGQRLPQSSINFRVPACMDPLSRGTSTCLFAGRPARRRFSGGLPQKRGGG